MTPKNITRSAIAGGVLAAFVGGYAGFGITHFGPVQAAMADMANQPNDESQDGETDPRDPFSQFFRRFPVPRGPRDENAAETHALGSAFIVSANGTILTNAHVVDGAQKVIIKLTDRREFKARVVGSDKQSDVAVLKIGATDLPVVKCGNPSATRVGDPVLAIGSPDGFDNTAASGIASAKPRTPPEGTYVPFLQTDVAVNPGNSGGPLFNLQGEVIDINSQIYSRTGGFQGLSFAIPIDVAANVEQQLVKSGKVTRGRLGIGIQELNQSLVDSFGLKSARGATVSMVEKDGLGAKAGLQAGDVITRVGDQEVNSSSDLPAQIAMMMPGTATRRQVICAGKAGALDVAIGEVQDKAVASMNPLEHSRGRLGVAVHPLAPQEQRQAGVPSSQLVEQASGPAARAGIQAGDVIISVNGTAVSTVGQLQQIVGGSGKKLALLVQRDSACIFVPIDLG
ncbi:MAG: trypsin-like peptidase domain-containing protein [Herminiimonas sp.]|nr:trypsin-like peptidase domain-containing protein [Herminiimonas sp.]